MAQVAFDTLAYTKKLTNAGYTQQQAEAQVEAQTIVFNELLDGKLATRQDIINLDNKIDKLELKLDMRIAEVNEKISQSTAAVYKIVSWGAGLIVLSNVILHYLPSKLG